MSNHLSIDGRLGQDPELRYSAAGKAFASFSVADTPRRFNPESQQWEDAGETLWLRCVAFGNLAEWVAEGCHRGDLVTLTGTLTSRSWDDKETGQKRTSMECKVGSIGVKKGPATTKGAAASTQWQQGGQPQADPWVTGGGAPSMPGLDEPPFSS